MHSLFVYGTLMYPERIKHLLGRCPDALSASLPGYARFLVRNATYPGIITAAGARTDGKIYLNLTDTELRRLDQYESDLYDRCLLSPQLDAGRTCEAWVYVIPEHHRHHLSEAPWDPITWRPKNLPNPNTN